MESIDLLNELSIIKKNLNEIQKGYEALQAKCEMYQKSIEKISHISYLVGQPGCTWCDTDLDSVAVAAGYNQALDNIVPIANEALSAGEGANELENG